MSGSITSSNLVEMAKISLKRKVAQLYARLCYALPITFRVLPINHRVDRIFIGYFIYEICAFEHMRVKRATIVALVLNGTLLFIYSGVKGF